MSDAAPTWTIRNLEDGTVRRGLSRAEAARELQRAMGAWTPEPQAELRRIEPRAERQVELVA